MRPLPRHLLSLASERCGLITAAELNSAGYTGRARKHALDSGMLSIVHRGVYRVAGHAPTFEQRCHAALLVAPHAVLSGPTAGRVWKLRRVFTDDIHVVSRRSVRLQGINGHQSDLLAPGDQQTVDGLRVLRPHRLLCDLAWHLDDAGLESVFEQLLDRGLLTVPGARAAASRFTARGRPGSTRIVRVLDGRPEWLRPVDSDLELRLWRALDGVGWRFDRQVPVRLDSGATVHVDLALPSIRLGVEVDHITWHGGRLDAQRDKRRDREMLGLGWRVTRVTDHDVRDDLDGVVGQIVAIASRLDAAAS